MTKWRLFVLALACSLGIAGAASGVRTARWEIAGRDAIGEGTPSGITVGPLGSLELAPRFEPVADLDEFYVWDAVADGKGNLYVGTGDQGRIYRIDSSGKATLLFDSLELDILSLALDRDGNLYAGTSPDGTILKIDTTGGGKTFFDSPEHYVWDLAVDGEGRLYAATGEAGKIYRIDRSGEAELFYDSPEVNILSLLWDGKNRRILAGGEGEGLLLSIDEEGKPSVLFDAPRSEVSAIALDTGGAIYAAASGNEIVPNGDKESRKKAILYRIGEDGTVVSIWTSEADYIYALAADRDGSVLVGTGSPGGLHRVDRNGEATELKRTAEAQVLDLHRSGDRIWLTTGNQGKVYVVGSSRDDEGVYESDVKDTGNLARWGILRWWGETPEGTEVLFSTRSGNTEEPDETWSEWAAVGDGEREGAIRSPSARFLQWRAELKGKEERSPRVDRVTVAFKENNLPPRLIELDVTRLGNTFFGGPADPRPEPMFQVLSNGTRVEYLPLESKNGAPGPADDVWASPVRIARWQAADPNGDELRFDVYYRAEGEAEWKPLGEDVPHPYYSWDTRVMPDGLYRVRVVASDDGANSESTALEGERVSDPFEIDNTPPEVVRLDVSREGEMLRVRGEARDGASPLLFAECSINSGDWSAVDPEDHVFDEKKESFDFSVKSAEGEELVFILRVSDLAGNRAVGKAVVR